MVLAQATFLLVALVALFQAKSFSIQPKINRLFSYGDDELSPKVIGGRDALEGEFPWMVALHFQGKFVCSSFLVTPKFLMTAAHCVVFGREAESPKHYNAYVGSINRDGPEQELLFDEIIAHESYGTGSEYDIALMRIRDPVQLGDSVQTVCLPTKDSVYEDMTAQAMGWGVATKDGHESSKIMQTAVEPIPLNSMCGFTYAILGVPVTRKHVCAGGDRDKGICFGDSGGPLVAMNETKPIAIGVASFGSFLGCAVNRVPAVYTATASYTDWIVEKMGDDASDLCFMNKTSENTRRWWG